MAPARRPVGFVPVDDDNFDEEGYIAANPDVAQAVAQGFFSSARVHFDIHGRNEGRMMAVFPPVLEPGRSSEGLKRSGRRAIGRIRARLAGRSLDERSDRSAEVEALATELAARVYDLEVLTNQLQHQLQYAYGIGPLPPKHLQLRVVGSYNGDFIRSGFRTVGTELNRALAVGGRSLNDFTSILDFGCGCGRATLALARQLPGARLHGTDIDPEAIAWLSENYGDLATYSVTPHEPPLDCTDGTFDLVFGISVFTHLPQHLQFLWLQELRRITRPGGYLVLTTHGEHHYSRLLDPQQLAKLLADGFLYVESGYGQSISLPAFYQTAFHTADYIRREWGRVFDVLDVLKPSEHGHQDVVVLRKPDR